MNEPSMSRSYSIEEIAQKTGQHKETILRHIRSGKLPAAKPGRSYIITLVDLEKYLGQERARHLFAEDEDTES